jgi:archaellum component FlaC
MRMEFKTKASAYSDRTGIMARGTEHFRMGASVMSKTSEEKIEELRRDIQKINNLVKAIALDVSQNQSLTLATSHYLEEVAELVKTLNDRCPGVASKDR